MRSLSRVQRNNVALIGDASGGVDAITGEGLRLAFRQAFALADAMIADDLMLYQRAHRCLLRRARLMGHLMLWLGRNPRIRLRVIRAMQKNPSFSRACWCPPERPLRNFCQLSMARLTAFGLAKTRTRENFRAGHDHCLGAIGLALFLSAGCATRQQSTATPATETVHARCPSVKVHWIMDTTLHYVHGTFNLKTARCISIHKPEKPCEIVVLRAAAKVATIPATRACIRKFWKPRSFPTRYFAPHLLKGSSRHQGPPTSSCTEYFRFMARIMTLSSRFTPT